MSTIKRSELKTEVIRIFAEGAQQPGHDIGHPLRSAELAEHIAVHEQYPDVNEAWVGGLLHDLGRALQPTETGHGPAGVPMASKLLDAYTDFDASAKRRVLKAIEVHTRRIFMRTTNSFALLRHRLAVGLVASLFLTAGILTTLPGTASAASCEDLNIPVALAAGLPKNQTISGTHCMPSSPSIVRSIDVLVPGGTYDKQYWDFPFDNYQHSYVKRTLAANRATFALDRIGSGKSSKPPSAAVTFQSEVYTLHQVIQWLKTNRNYNDVTSIGHSVGSVVAIQESAAYNDVERLVVTGFYHSPSFKVITTLGTSFYPAMLDPQFADEGLDPGYITTLPGQREKAFYSSSADRDVIAYDDAHKAIMSLVSLQGVVTHGLAPALLNNSRNVTVPVLTIAGDQDILCGPPVVGINCASSETVRDYEKNYYTKAASLTSYVVPDTGHNLPMHPSANESFGVIDRWIKNN